MNDRARAIALLKQAREMLAERLTERVLDGSDELLDDAAGFSYMGEIEALYEQIGTRLVHVSQMISNLPPVNEPPEGDYVSDESSATATQDIGDGGTESIIVGGPVGLKTPGLPGPATSDLVHSLRPPSFQTFATQIQSGDVDGAGRTLAVLFGVDEPRGVQCASIFAERLANEPGFLAKAMQLRKELEKDGINAAIMLLHECFGLNGLECVGVLQTLRANLKQG
ncbi:MAG: hypothetical protein RIC55_29460 [Pirellulaceae bacterium]